MLKRIAPNRGIPAGPRPPFGLAFPVAVGTAGAVGRGRGEADDALTFPIFSRGPGNAPGGSAAQDRSDAAPAACPAATWSLPHLAMASSMCPIFMPRYPSAVLMVMASASMASKTRRAYLRPLRARHSVAWDGPPGVLRLLAPPSTGAGPRLICAWQREYSAPAPSTPSTSAARIREAALLTQNLSARASATAGGSPQPAPPAASSASRNLSSGIRAAAANLSHHRSTCSASPAPGRARTAAQMPSRPKTTWAYSWRSANVRCRGVSRELASTTAGSGRARASPDAPSSAGIASCMAKMFLDSILSLTSLYLRLSLAPPPPDPCGGPMPRASAFRAAADAGLCPIAAACTSGLASLPMSRSISAALPWR